MPVVSVVIGVGFGPSVPRLVLPRVSVSSLAPTPVESRIEA